MRGFFYRWLFVLGLVPTLLMTTTQVVHAACGDTQIYLGPYQIMLDRDSRVTADSDLGGGPRRLEVTAHLRSEESQAVLKIHVMMAEQRGDGTVLNGFLTDYIPISGLRPPYCNYWGANFASGIYTKVVPGSRENWNEYISEREDLIEKVICQTNTPGDDLNEVGCHVYLRDPVTVHLSSLIKGAEMNPIAYGTVRDDGTLTVAQPPGITASLVETGPSNPNVPGNNQPPRGRGPLYYEIKIPGESFQTSKYTVLVTPHDGAEADSAIIMDYEGDMMVILQDASHNIVQSDFSFVVYK